MLEKGGVGISLGGNVLPSLLEGSTDPAYGPRGSDPSATDKLAAAIDKVSHQLSVLEQRFSMVERLPDLCNALEQRLASLGEVAENFRQLYTTSKFDDNDEKRTALYTHRAASRDLDRHVSIYDLSVKVTFTKSALRGKFMLEALNNESFKYLLEGDDAVFISENNEVAMRMARESCGFVSIEPHARPSVPKARSYEEKAKFWDDFIASIK